MSFPATKQLIRKSQVDAFGRTLEERDAEQRLIEAANKEAAEHWDDPVWRREMAADLTESIQYGFNFETLFRTYIDSQNVGFTDRIIVREVRGLKAFWTARGGDIEESQLRSDLFEVPRDTLGFHVSEHEDKLRVNWAESIADLRQLGTQRMDAEINRRLHDLITAAIPIGSPYYISGATLAQASLNLAIRGVQDAQPFPGVPITVLGRAPMVDQIADFTGYGIQTLEEIRQVGYLGRYRGAQIIRLTNYLDEDDLPYFPGNEALVFAGNVGKFGFFGPVLSKEGVESYNWYYHYLARQDAGGVILKPERARRIVDTSLPV